MRLADYRPHKPSRLPGYQGTQSLGIRLEADVLARMDRLILGGRIGCRTRNQFARLACERLVAEYARQLGDGELTRECEIRQAQIDLLGAQREAHALEGVLLGCDSALRPLLECGEVDLARQTLHATLVRIGEGEPEPWKDRVRAVLSKRYPQLMEEETEP